MSDIRLMHRSNRYNTLIRFYDGVAFVEGGVVTIPHGHPAWVGRAYNLGYSLDPATGNKLPVQALIRSNSRAENAKSEEQKVEQVIESPDGGRQPARHDWVRTSAEGSTEGVSETGLGSDGSDGTTVRGEGDGPAAEADSDLEGRPARIQAPRKAVRSRRS